MWNPFKRKLDVAQGPIGFEDDNWGKQHGQARAYVRENKKGERETVIIGEKYPLRGHSRAEMLEETDTGWFGKIAQIKDLTKLMIKTLSDSEKDMIPQDKLKIPVRAMAEVFDLLIEATETGYVKNTWKMMKKTLVSVAEEDDEYCFIMQWFFEKIAKRMKDIKLSKADKYYFYARPGFKWWLKKCTKTNTESKSQK